MRKGEFNSVWITVKVHGPTPGKRYGHTMVFVKPHLVVFGGHADNELRNDTWVLSIEKVPFVWEKVVTAERPPERIYHTASVCAAGQAAGTLFVFGGRASDQTALNDVWGLRKRKDAGWDWVKAPYKRSKIPAARYQVSYIDKANIL